jgi:hypothetical protein
MVIVIIIITSCQNATKFNIMLMPLCFIIKLIFINTVKRFYLSNINKNLPAPSLQESLKMPAVQSSTNKTILHTLAGFIWQERGIQGVQLKVSGIAENRASI